MTSYPQFGQIQSLAAPQLLNSTVTVSKPGSTSPLENSSGSPDHPHHQPSTAGMTANPLTAAAQSPYSAAGATMAASYNPALFSYTRLPGLSGESMYGSAAAALAPTQGLYSLGTDPAAFYVNPLTGTPYDLKDNAEIWRNLSQSAATCFPYDPTGFGAYGYGYGGMDLSLAARRKNATKENTSTLKAWLNEHKKNPYPTKGEKIMLAIITKMTLTQVSTWFANARRRLKKDNKMTWSPRTKGEDSDDEHAEEGNKSGDDMDSNEHGTLNHNANSGDKDGDDEGNHVDVTSCDSDEEDGVDPLREPRGFMPHPGMPSQSNTSSRLNNSHNKSNSVDNSPCTSPSGPSSRSPITQSDTPPRPRIWSLADVLGPSTGPSTSGSTLSSDTRTYMGASSGAGLSFPMPLKPTVSTPNGLGYSPTAASLRHWAERSPYSIPGAAALSASPFAAGVGTRPSLPLGTTGGLPGGALTQNSQATGLSVTVSATDALRAHAHTIDKPAELGGHSPADPLPLTAFRPVPRSNICEILKV